MTLPRYSSDGCFKKQQRDQILRTILQIKRQLVINLHQLVSRSIVGQNLVSKKKLTSSVQTILCYSFCLTIEDKIKKFRWTFQSQSGGHVFLPQKKRQANYWKKKCSKPKCSYMYYKNCKPIIINYRIFIYFHNWDDSRFTISQTTKSLKPSRLQSNEHPEENIYLARSVA